MGRGTEGQLTRIVYPLPEDLDAIVKRLERAVAFVHRDDPPPGECAQCTGHNDSTGHPVCEECMTRIFNTICENLPDALEAIHTLQSQLKAKGE
jgi:hypothetical protein